MDPKTFLCKSYSVRHYCFIYSNILLTYSVAHAASWWMMFGSSTPKLQYLAMRLVSQCCSSSGCERNWSTFALLHTKVRNRLSHKKLNKLNAGGEGERSPPYQESEDSSSADDGDDGDGAQPNAGGGGSGADDAAGGSGHARGVRFTGIYCTYKYTHISDY